MKKFNEYFLEKDRKSIELLVRRLLGIPEPSSEIDRQNQSSLLISQLPVSKRIDPKNMGMLNNILNGQKKKKFLIALNNLNNHSINDLVDLVSNF